MTQIVASRLNETTLIVAVGSVDGVLSAAALLRVLGDPDLPVVFTQAFQVNTIDPATWPANSKVVFVDLAVNNQDKTMTADFVARVGAAGHEVLAIIDEHDAVLWGDILGDRMNDLVIKPISGKGTGYYSSGALLARELPKLGYELDAVTLQLLADADAGDRMDFSGPFGSLANRAVKSAIADNSRREVLARFFAGIDESYLKIWSWIQEYEQILANHAEILAAKQDLGDGMIRIDATGRSVDMTALMSGLYKSGAKVVVLVVEQFNPIKKQKEILVSFGAADPKLDLLGLCKEAGLNPVGGKGPKVNFDLADEAAVTEVIRGIITKLAA